MTQGLSGPGLGLPLPQNLYPSELGNAPYDSASNKITLNAADTFVIPSGDWLVGLGMYCVLQYLDPITGVWTMGPTAGWQGGHQFIKSDGFNIRVANLLQCPTSATVTAGGGGWTQSTTTITVTGGTSTWLPIIGGALTFSTLSAAGAGYGIPPIALIPPPPPAANNANGVGGVPATGYCTIASGTVSGFTFTNPGSGYPSAPTVVIVPSPFDPNLATGITAATIGLATYGANSLTGALCTNPGSTLATVGAATAMPITLTPAGAGTNATLLANVLTTIITASVFGQGTGYGPAAELTTVGGAPPTSGSLSLAPDALLLGWRPRPAQVGLTIGGAGSVTTQLGAIYDGGLFHCNTTPNYVVLTQPATTVTQAFVAATITLTFGPRPDIITLQPAP